VGEEHAWEAGADKWVELVRTGGHATAHDAVIRELLPPPSGLLVDAGCGEGRWVRELRALGYDVVGVDRSAKLLGAARADDPEGRYETGTIEDLPVADGAAAIVLCVNVLMHVVDLDAALRELARVLAPGGTLVLGLTHPVMEAGTFDDETEELRLSGYFAAEEHAVPLGEHHVAHQHRTIEGYVRPLLAAGFALEDLREVPGRTGGIPRYLDLRLRRR
jgi:ubiquinone/menaquinone biosynthesis C-methylase UbiE